MLRHCIILFTTVFLPQLSHAYSCYEPKPDTCDFYIDCLEEDVSCGPQGYALGYGHKYCERFKSSTLLSPQGEIWRSETMSCLQYALIDDVLEALQKPSCENIIDIAFDSHPECYTIPGASICSLGLHDMKTIVGTIDHHDLLSPRGTKQMSIVAQACIMNLGQVKPKLQKNTDPDFDVAKRIQFWESLIGKVDQ